MKKVLFSLMVLCAAMMVQAQTMRVGNKFWDGYSLYTVKEIRNLRHPKGTKTMYYEAHGSTEANLRHPKGTKTMYYGAHGSTESMGTFEQSASMAECSKY